MKSLAFMALIVALALLSITTGLAQAPATSWPYFAEVNGIHAPGLYQLAVPLHVLDKARDDLADLRLFDANGREIPYAPRIRRELSEQREVGGQIFNQAIAGGASEASVDLGENPGPHNEVQVETSGSNFRRRVAVEGSDTTSDWHLLQAGSLIFNFQADNQRVESNRVSYATSRYRYLRVRVYADELTDKRTPEITGIKVAMALRQTGELTNWTASTAEFDLIRKQGAPASSWTIDLGARVPCDRLGLEIADESFSRPFELEVIDDPQNARLIASGDLSRRKGSGEQPLVIKFDNEEYVRKLRLSIVDYSNQMLTITAFRPAAPARQLIFELKAAPAQPLRLFFGNTKATPPHYDFEKELPAKPPANLTRVEVGTLTDNPNFKPEPLPLTERVPWLIYVVLAASSIALGYILFSLARTAMRSEAPSEH